jgi:hypothetical protein
VLAQAAFFARALALLESASDEQLAACVEQYAAFLADGAKGKPSLGVEIVWRTHLLHPLCYLHACASLAPGGVEPSDRLRTIIDHSPSDHASDYTDATLPACKHDATCVSWLGLDLVGALRRQQSFMRGLLVERLESVEGVRRTICEYVTFLRLTKHSTADLEPMALVDLVWHTHMLYPRRYAIDCLRIAGSFLDHIEELDAQMPTGAL